MKKLFYQSVIRWVPLGVAIVFVFGAIYLVAQQNYRTAANDPQVQIAEDLMAQMDAGQSSVSLNEITKVDMEFSTSTFIIAYDRDKKIIANSSTLAGETLSPPTETLNNIKEDDLLLPKNQNRFTWEPKNGVRIATVIIKGEKGYVLAGRNMREEELRIRTIQILEGIFMLFALGATLATTFLMDLLVSGKIAKPKLVPNKSSGPKLASKKAKSKV